MIRLRNGLSMPSIGLGTYRITKYDQIFTAIQSALESKYKLIDTASVYRNEAHIAKALDELNADRKSLFITSKLAPKDHGTEKAKAAVEKSLSELKTDYLDLYLIHWPGIQNCDPKSERNKDLRLETWKVLEQYHNQGILKAIGVSNYEIPHLKELLAECQVLPMVNQIEVHPHFQQRDLVQFCQDHEIHVTAYSSLGRTVEVSPLLTDPTVIDIANECSKSEAQVLLKWALTKGFSVLPKSTNPNHIRDNCLLDFDLSVKDVDRLNEIEVNTKYAWNPSVVA
ncbi:glyoxal reductase-like isoform X4 [Tigriopus californicus]|nr:glyoxal reductase-like isoform X4 [Tigriopus californicus]XP_059084707.1 glyoxal reductase-like isoform X4 [Tigriopus californicus]XP_059084708.1 glyoxal reductase-like isoform X4 [Tigriopus californicus]